MAICGVALVILFQAMPNNRAQLLYHQYRASLLIREVLNNEVLGYHQGSW